MKTALITGASSGIGKAIYNLLQINGYRVYGISRNSVDIPCDLKDQKDIQVKIKKLLRDTDVDVLVNCAGFGVFEPHEEISPQKISDLLDVNLKAPILLINLCLRSLKKTKGHIVNISSIEATRHSKFSALYTASKSGLRDFSLSLFEELRKSGVRVTNINPDITQSAFFDDLKFAPSSELETHILPHEISQNVLHVLQSSSVITDLTIRPQKLKILKK